MLYRGRELDVLALWDKHVDLPNVGNPLPTYLPKMVCPNPDHQTSKRHFQINTRKPWVHCFADCGISGSYEHAFAVILGIYGQKGITPRDLELTKAPRSINEPPDVSQARERVGAAHKAARRAILQQTMEYTGKKPHAEYAGLGTRKSHAADSELAKDEAALRGGTYQYLPKKALAYLDKRGLDASTRGKWEIGYDEDAERIVIPGYDHTGKFAFLIRREVSGSSSLKYLYTPGAIKTNILFGACYADMNRVRSDGAILVEGSLDTIRLHQMGFRTAMGILGTGISKKQVRLLDRFGPRRIYCFFDKDAAGVTNIVAANERIAKVPLFVVRYPRGKSDPAEMTREEVERALERSVPVSQFLRTARDVVPTKTRSFA